MVLAENKVCNGHKSPFSQFPACWESEATQELGAAWSSSSDAVAEVRAGADGFVWLRPEMGSLVPLPCTEQILNLGQYTLSSEGA